MFSSERELAVIQALLHLSVAVAVIGSYFGMNWLYLRFRGDWTLRIPFVVLSFLANGIGFVCGVAFAWFGGVFLLDPSAEYPLWFAIARGIGLSILAFALTEILGARGEKGVIQDEPRCPCCFGKTHRESTAHEHTDALDVWQCCSRCGDRQFLHRDDPWR